jgi:haloacetate dehalogenase
MSLAGLEGLEKRTAHVNGVDIAYRATASGKPPLLLLHGHPQTHVIWHRVVPALSEHFTLVLPDLRGYGDSSKPPASADHANHSKRVMAADNVALMAHLGHARFSVLAHDRGARVAHRLAADHPDAVERLVLLDIAPTLGMYEGTDETFARKYWHWFFLIQPAPMPETFIASSPETFLRACMVKFAGGNPFDDAAFEEYLRCAKLDGWAVGVCEDYRAAASIDLEHDRADRDAGRKIQAPLLAIWGAKGVVEMCFDPLAEWRRVAADVRGGTVPCGHYIPEEAPDALLDRALPFLLGKE